MRLLVDRGLPAHERYRGAVVARLGQARIDEIFDYRKVLELGAPRMALVSGADLTPCWPRSTTSSRWPRAPRHRRGAN
ncbi:hypothetical protein [Lentzea sp. NBRC 102530]|uniref:hypothetical protein n=1 Tax=Lentzea sp. NBRC 102530 TaxID=3032201 RepID=UPI0025539F69|nr:hypothetical protein [Lentzea sp. NBRC 102530]